MQLGFAHCSFQSKNQPIIKMSWVVNSIFIENKRIHERANFEEPMPVRRIACEPRNFQTHDDASSTHTHFRHQSLKAFAVCRGGSGLSEVGVDDDNLSYRPSECDCALPEIILPFCALAILQNLSQGRLA